MIRGISRKKAYLIGVIVSLAVDFLFRNVILLRSASDINIGFGIMAEWLILGWLLCSWIPKNEREDRWHSIGFGSFRWKYPVIAFAVYIIVMIVWGFSAVVLGMFGLGGLRSLQPMLKQLSSVILVGLFLTGTIFEEILYRGYLIERLTALTGKVWLAGFVSWLAFTLVHIRFFGLGATLDVSILSAALVILYVKKRSIWPCILLHGMNNLFGFVIAPLLF